MSNGEIEVFDAPGGKFYGQREVRIDDQDPLTVIPHGDRLLVEIVAVDDSIPLPDGQKILVERDEYGRGWAAGVVWNVGNGHQLEAPDQAVAITTTNDNIAPELGLVFVDPETKSGVVMAQSRVPMPFARGMVVMCAKFAGSDIRLQGKAFKIITQAHVIAVFSGVKMEVGEVQK